jgi:hypothetical protein
MGHPAATSKTTRKLDRDHDVLSHQEEHGRACFNTRGDKGYEENRACGPCCKCVQRLHVGAVTCDLHWGPTKFMALLKL